MEDLRLEINNLTKKYGDFVALDNISLIMEPGIYAILGLNGAGKSTMINLITDNLTRTDGKVLFNGADILSLGSKYRNIVGYMPQEQGYYGEFTARSYLYYMASLKGIKKKKAGTKINELLEQFNLTSSADKKMSEFSGGMRQRTILAQTLLNDPLIIILDEPTAGLDPKERVNFKEYIKNISKNKIVIYCTHVVSDIENIANKILLMKNGKILKMCSVDELYAEIPKDKGENLEQAFMYYME